MVIDRSIRDFNSEICWASITAPVNLPSKSRITGVAMSFNNSSYSFASLAFARNKFRMPTFPSSFFNFIINIILICSKPKMLRVLTNWVIAMVEDVKSFWNLAKMDHPSKSMSENVFFIKPKLPILNTFPSARFPEPFPTLIFGILGNFTPISSSRFFTYLCNHAIIVPYYRRVIKSPVAIG